MATRAASSGDDTAAADPVQALRSLAAVRQALEGGELPRAELVGFLVEALAAIESGEDPAHALGLALAAGQEHPARTLARERRDAWLAAALEATDGATTWARARALAAAVGEFQARRWPRWRAWAEPPGHATDQQRALFQAARVAEAAGLQLPTSAKALAALSPHGSEMRVFPSTPAR
ncbi:hypothetical protein QWY84_11900 [Aquisalimonas lutea]|uniref:hypothetical protein n=1 Tax=Aquisalimonas lutea TaxID=1327750 RepID=UPI0025B443ED|nr:hypothetical protein [Aquisalimonas lutea]MDN3518317.1 hypothetical protein [Aquisalimonas lutea]